EVLSKYIGYRFTRDEPRVAARFHITADELRTVAENCAFAMTADTGIGLSPTLGQLKKALAHQNTALSSEKLGAALNALIYMKLGRSSQSEAVGDEAEFTFSHRRFQEHFATCVVLRDTQSITHRQLLTDARWRETAVTMLQTGDEASVQSLLDCAWGLLTLTPAQQAMTANSETRQLQAFPWAPAQLHILRILEAGTLGGVERMPAAMRAEIGKLLALASATENLLDRKLALEVAGTAPHDALIELMSDALATGSVWLSDIVYQQASRLAAPVSTIYRSVRISVLRLSRSGALRTEYVATKAYLSRLPSPANLLAALRLSNIAPLIDFLLLPAILIIAALNIEGMRFGIAAVAIAIFWVAGLLMRRAEIESPIGMFGLSMRIVACMIASFSAPYLDTGPEQHDRDAKILHLWELMRSGLVFQKDELALPKFPLPETWDYQQIALVIGLIYAAIWYIAAEVNIRRGRHLSPLMWPFFPPLLLWDMLMIIIRRPERLKRMAMLIAGGMTLPLFVFVLIPIFPPLGFALLILMASFTLAAMVSLTDAFVRMGRGQIFVRRWQKDHASKVDAEAFSKLIPLVEVPWANVAALRWLADQPLAGPPATWVSAIEAAIEASAAAMEPPTRRSGIGFYFRERFPTARTLRALFNSSYIEQHDRLYRLLERVTANYRNL
ncbi:hypothetical protein, partial [Sphingopyxis sp.]|uniref:hypothetical protein n=1 Tax=Sphingopyxis sp. TaxID=1908224 RepID=UPI002EDB2539